MSPNLISKSAILPILLMLPQAVAAQDLCGGLGSNGQWIGGNEGASDIATSDTFQEQMALVLGGNEYVSLFSLSEMANVRVEAQGRGSGDPLIDLLDGDGNIVLSDDDSGGNGAARAEVELAPGTYCVSMSSYDGAPMTAFVRIGRTEQEALTEGIADTTTLSDTADFEGSCSDGQDLGTFSDMLTAEASVNDAPFWRFSLSEPAAISIIAQNEDADPYLTLYDGAESLLAENDDFDGLNARLDMSNPLPAGDYCIGLDALNDTSLPIYVEISTYDPVAALNSMYARGEAAPPTDGSYPVTALGSLSTRMRQDAQINDTTTWFSVEIGEAGLMVVEAIATGGNGDPWVVIFDDFGRQIAMNDDNGDSLDSLATARVNPGTYMVGVKQVNTGVQGFVNIVLERYVPAK